MTKSSIEKNLALTEEDLESFFINNSDLTKIEAHLNQFNPIKVMKMESMEIRHSAILGWLLDPRENHGLEDRFLKAFLADALIGYKYCGSVSSLEVSIADLRDSIVRIEWNHIDIFIYCGGCGPSGNEMWTFVIENKFHSKKHGDQLARYREKIENHFDVSRSEDKVPLNEKVIKVTGVYLTLHDEEIGSDPYAHTYYEDIVGILGSILKNCSKILTPEVAIFIKHYINILKEVCNMSEEQEHLEKLARDLYQSHKQVIDFVIEHGTATDFAMAVRRIFGDIPDDDKAINVGSREYYYEGMGSDYVDFYPKVWTDKFDNDSEHRYDFPLLEDWEYWYPLICWFQLRPSAGDGAETGTGSIELHAGLLPLSNLEARKDLIERVNAGKGTQSKRIVLSKRVKVSSKSTLKFYSKEHHLDDISDSQEIETMMRKLLESYESEIDAIAAKIDGFHKYGTKIKL